MKYFVVAFLVFSSVFLKAQNIRFSAKLVDENKQAIPYVNVFLKESLIASTSNLEGVFTLVLNKKNLEDSLVIRHISYETKAFLLSKDLVDTLKQIELKTKQNKIGAVEVKAYSAVEIIAKSISKIETNYLLKPHYSEGFYRQAHKENSNYVRLLECFASVEVAQRINRYDDRQKERFAIDKLRRSKVYERNGDQHGDHLVDLFLENPIYYAQAAFLNKNAYQLYNYWYGKAPKEHLIKIYFQNKPWSVGENKTGFVLINRKDYAIVHIELFSTQNKQKKGYSKSNWVFQNGYYKAKFRKENGSYYCYESAKYYNHYVLNERTKSIDFIVEEYFDWYHLRHRNLDDPVLSKKRFKALSSLYSKAYVYQAEDWQEIPFRNLQIAKDLNRYMDLELQFEKEQD